MLVALFRSIIFALFSYIAIIVLAPVLIFGRLLPFKQRYYVVFSYGFTVMWLARLITGIRWQIEGLEHLSGASGRLIASKHQSTWDSMILPTILNKPAFVLKKELLWIPIFGTGLAGMNPIAIDRKAGSQALKHILKQGKAAIAEGRDVIIFPEGTRYRPDAVPEYKIGAAMLAIQAKADVIPIALNSGCHWPKGQFLKRPCVIHVVIGAPIPVAGKRANVLSAEIEHWIETEQEKLYMRYGCPTTNRAPTTNGTTLG